MSFNLVYNDAWLEIQYKQTSMAVIYDVNINKQQNKNKRTTTNNGNTFSGVCYIFLRRKYFCLWNVCTDICYSWSQSLLLPLMRTMAGIYDICS